MINTRIARNKNSTIASSDNTTRIIVSEQRRMQDLYSNVTNVQISKSKQNKCRSSILKCTSKFSDHCVEEKAMFYCEDCKCNQCESCDSDAHDKITNHVRRKLLSAQDDLLCQQRCKLLNFADVYCLDCKFKFCYKCYAELHKNNQHTYTPFIIQNKPTQEQMTKKQVPNEDIFPSLKNRENTNESINLENYLFDDIDLNDERTTMSLNSLNNDQAKSFLLIDGNETIQAKSREDFIEKLKLDSDDRQVKCVSIFGNTGDGKSHTLNETFFNGKNVFLTSNKQESCTIGVWCAFDKKTSTLIFDTEGLLGTSSDKNKQMRLLLKILAISDIVVYRTRAERLPADLFKFLADASEAYAKHFRKELNKASKKLKLDVSLLSPYVVIFHETTHTDVLSDDHLKTIEMKLNDRFRVDKLTCEAFRSIEYVGTKTSMKTDFTELQTKIFDLLKNNSVRSPRKISVIYQLLKALNDKFDGEINVCQMSTFPDEYFSCDQTCLACGVRCMNSMNHIKDRLLHENSSNCKYVHQFDNRVYVCKKCHDLSNETILIPRASAQNENALVGMLNYAMSGFVLECPDHGVIYRSRQYWYGNATPELSGSVRTEIKHVWPGQLTFPGTSPNATRKMIDGLNLVGTVIKSVSAPVTKCAKQLMIDQIAPTYWTPDSEIVSCFKCKRQFEDNESKHHCRGCGKGFCDSCSIKRKIIPWWSASVEQRVCDECFKKDDIKKPTPDVTSRIVCETLTSTISNVTKIPLDFIKDSARPSYWKPDSECVQCELCKKKFSETLPLHHCRNCGNGVCDPCSPHLKAVPVHDWEYPVRVCNACFEVLSQDNTKE